MPQSKLFGLLDDIKSKSLIIGQQLSRLNTTPEEIEVLYIDRQAMLEKLEMLIKDESANEAIQRNSARWIKEVENIQEIEKENIKNIKNLTMQIQNKLKQQMKAKSILIYAK